MIEQFTKAWFANLHKMREKFTAKHPDDYKDVVQAVVEMLHEEIDKYGDQPDPKRIHVIDDGQYQGTLVYVIGAAGYQPDTYWYVKVDYGSCGGCDTMCAISGYSDAPPNEKQVTEYMQLALHIVQRLKRMGDD